MSTSPIPNSSGVPSVRHRLGRLVVITSLAVMATVPLTGCNSIRAFDESAALTWRDYVWSRRGYNLRYGNCDRPYGEHFQNGFRAGYSDVAGGGDGYVPALPPESYRTYEYQSQDGAKCVSAWFEGYPAGVAAARKDKAGTYNNVMISKMINDAVKQEKTKTKLPDDVDVIQGRGDLSNRQDAPSRYTAPALDPTDDQDNQPPFNLFSESSMIPANFPSPTLNQPVPIDSSPLVFPGK